uniref:SEFIR domain-containing protein n=1 Tax=Caenorhabditis japonica TaxID=281687 RepID=A0A8R1DFE4_CAEJA
MEMIIRDATHNLIASKRKYCIVRLPYSPEVPANLAVLNFPVFNLPDQFGQLTAFLHDFENIDQLNISQPLSQSRMTSFREAVRLQMTFFEQNPDWLDTRWRPIDEPAIPQIREQRLPVEISTDEDRIAAAKLYGIDPPRADSEDEETGVGPSNERQFMLHPPANEPDTDTDNDDLSTSEDEIDDEDEEGGEMHTVVFRPDNLF